jgi:hypothetical protein
MTLIDLAERNLRSSNGHHRRPIEMYLKAGGMIGKSQCDNPGNNGVAPWTVERSSLA